MWILAQISGDNSEVQLLTAAEHFINRPDLLTRIFHKVYYIIEDNHIANQRKMFNVSHTLYLLTIKYLI